MTTLTTSTTFPKIFSIVFWLCILQWIVLQICAVSMMADIPMTSDALNFAKNAAECVDVGAWYPMPSQLLYSHGTYICYPGYINLIILCINIFGSVKACLWLNILFNVICAACLWRIGRDLCGNTSGKIIALLYCMMPFTVTTVTEAQTELPSMAIAFVAVVLLGRRHWGWFILSGFLFIISQYLRTIGLVFAIASLAYLIMNKAGIRKISSFVGGLIIGAITIYTINYTVSGGRMFLSATTLGCNMIMGASDVSDGGYNTNVFDEPGLEDGFDNFDVFQIDSVYTNHSINWIKENPGKWVSYIPAKMHLQLCVDPHLTFGRSALKLPETGFWRHVRKDYPYIFQVTIYLTFLYGLWMRRRHLRGADGAILLALLGCVALAILTVGNPRYLYPFMPCLIYFSSFVFKQFFVTLRKIKE